jgi:predicted transcriptional regulator
LPSVSFDFGSACSYALTMEVSFPSDLEEKLANLASVRGRDSAALVVEAVEHLVEHDAWFVAEVEKGLAQIEAGQTLSHEEVGTNLKQYLASKLFPS